jgi:hypothetical protein
VSGEHLSEGFEMRLPNIHPWTLLAGAVLITAHRSPLTAQMPAVERERREYARWLASAPTSPLGAVALAPVGRGIEIGGRRSDVPLEGLPLHRITEDRGRLTLSGPQGNRPLVRGRPVTIGGYTVMASGLPGRTTLAVHRPPDGAHEDDLLVSIRSSRVVRRVARPARGGGNGAGARGRWH